MPMPDIETARTYRAQEACVLPTILTVTAVDRRPGRSNLREHVKSHHGYLDEDTSDEESMERDDEADIYGDVCHTGCEVGYNRRSYSCFGSDLSFYSLFSSHFLRQSTRPFRPSCPVALCRSTRKPRLRFPQRWKTASTVECHYYVFTL